jgi:hypothetical protein
MNHGWKCHFSIDSGKSSRKTPEGLQDLFIIHDEASTNDRRRELLSRVGIKILDRVEV